MLILCYSADPIFIYLHNFDLYHHKYSSSTFEQYRLGSYTNRFFRSTILNGLGLFAECKGFSISNVLRFLQSANNLEAFEMQNVYSPMTNMYKTDYLKQIQTEETWMIHVSMSVCVRKYRIYMKCFCTRTLMHYSIF